MPRSLKSVLFALVLLGLVGGSAAYVAAQKSVTLTVDGQAREVRTYAGTVGDVLEEEGLQTQSHDVVLPDAAAPVSDGDTVVLNRARPLTLTVDGVQSEVYVTALSVDEALAQLGYRAEDLVVSASRSERLPLDGMDLSITTPKDVTLVVDGQERVVTTTAATAGDLLALDALLRDRLVAHERVGVLGLDGPVVDRRGDGDLADLHAGDLQPHVGQEHLVRVLTRRAVTAAAGL